MFAVCSSLRVVVLRCLLMFVDVRCCRCLSFVVCCLLCVVRHCSLFVVCCVISCVVCWLLLVACCLLFVLCLWVAFGYLLLVVIQSLLSFVVARCSLFIVCCLLLFDA